MTGSVHGTQYVLNEKGYQFNLLLTNVSEKRGKDNSARATGSGFFISFNELSSCLKYFLS